jgi:hypothetical protein
MKNEKNIVQKVGIALFCFLMSVSAVSGEAFVECSSRIEESETAKNRFIADLDGTVLLFYDARSSWPEGETRLGVELPFLLIGPLSEAGIIRELGNPLGFAPGSAVFDEEPDFMLYKGFSSSVRNGLIFHSAKQGPDFLLLLRKDAGASAGICGRLEARAGCYADYFLCRTVLPAAEPGERWFDSRCSLPGNELLHAGMRLGWESAEGRALITSAYSCSPAAPGGILLHLLFGPETSVFDLRILGAYCSEHYRDFEGLQSRSAIRLGAEGALQPLPSLSVDAAASWILRRPENPDNPYRESSLVLSSAAELSLGDFRISLRGEHGVEYADSEPVVTDSVRAGLCLDSRSLRISIDGEQEWENGRPGLLQAGTRLRLSGEGFSCTVGMKAHWDEELHLDASLLLGGSTDEGSWFFKAALREALSPEELFAPGDCSEWFKRLAMDFGWKVKSNL